MSKWKAHCKVKGEIATEIGMEYRIMFLFSFIGRVDGFHAHVETQDEKVEIEPYSKSV